MCTKMEGVKEVGGEHEDGGKRGKREERDDQINFFLNKNYGAN